MISVQVVVAQSEKENRVGIMELTPAVLDLRISSAPERTIMDILAGIRKPEFETIRRIIEALRICIHELCIDEKGYAVCGVCTKKYACKADYAQ